MLQNVPTLQNVLSHGLISINTESSCSKFYKPTAVAASYMASEYKPQAVPLNLLPTIPAVVMGE